MPTRKTRGISASTNLGGHDLFYSFTSSTEFESEKSYSKFAVYATLEHAGDFAAAARALRGHGYDATPSAPITTKTGTDREPAALEDADEDTDLAPWVDASWPAPLSRAAYVGIFGDIVDTLAPQTEADPAALFFQFLGMFGSVIGRTAHFRVEADTHYLNLFVAMVGRTAKGRKGVSEGQARRFFDAIDPTWTRDCQASGPRRGRPDCGDPRPS